MRYVAIVVLLAGCPSQKSIEDSLRASASQRMSCPKDQIVITGYVWGGRTWTESGCGRVFDCQLQQHASTDCSETPASKARTIQKIVVERVILDSGCSSVKIVGKTAWRQGSEQAYRLEGCGKAYTCTTATGRTDCRLAISQPQLPVTEDGVSK